MKTAEEWARDTVAYYKGLAKGLGLTGLPLEHRLVEGITLGLRAYAAECGERLREQARAAARRYKGGVIADAIGELPVETP